MNSTENSTNHPLTLQEDTDAINIVVPPILLAVSSILNFLAILVMRSRYFRTVSTSIYMTACAVNDITSLSILLIPHWLAVNFPGSIIRTQCSRYMCSFFNFYGWSNTDFTIIAIAAMTADRAESIVFPLRALSLNRTKLAKQYLIIVALIVVAKNFHFLFTSDIVPSGRRYRLCDVYPPTKTYSYFYNNVWVWIHAVFITVCFGVILISAGIIIRTIQLASAKSYTLQMAKQFPRSSTKWRQTAIMLLAMSVALFLLTYPFTVNETLTIGDSYDDLTNKKKDVNALVFSFVLYLQYCNKCINFWLYFACASKFRLVLWQLMKCDVLVKKCTSKKVHHCARVPPSEDTSGDGKGLHPTICGCFSSSTTETNNDEINVIEEKIPKGHDGIYGAYDEYKLQIAPVNTMQQSILNRFSSFGAPHTPINQEESSNRL